MGNITPKEAIANLNHIYGMVAPDIQRSLDVAIKALERPTGDLISREALKKSFIQWSCSSCDFRTSENPTEICCENCYAKGIEKEVIDNAPTVPLPSEQIAWKRGYEYGYHQAKDDAIRRIAKQYSEHHELVPYWLSIGDMKGGAK